MFVIVVISLIAISLTKYAFADFQFDNLNNLDTSIGNSYDVSDFGLNYGLNKDDLNIGLSDYTSNDYFLGSSDYKPRLQPMYNPYDVSQNIGLDLNQEKYKINPPTPKPWEYHNSDPSSGLNFGLSSAGPTVSLNQPGVGSIGVGSMFDSNGHSLGISGSLGIDINPNQHINIEGFRTNNNVFQGASISLNHKF
tara:strand:+ start:7447 stop:8028 length:582 start_codon:yes stop_codon:yes gene_type:complete